MIETSGENYAKLETRKVETRKVSGVVCEFVDGVLFQQEFKVRHNFPRCKPLEVVYRMMDAQTQLPLERFLTSRGEIARPLGTRRIRGYLSHLECGGVMQAIAEPLIETTVQFNASNITFTMT